MHFEWGLCDAFWKIWIRKYHRLWSNITRRERLKNVYLEFIWFYNNNNDEIHWFRKFILLTKNEWFRLSTDLGLIWIFFLKKYWVFLHHLKIVRLIWRICFSRIILSKCNFFYLLKILPLISNFVVEQKIFGIHFDFFHHLESFTANLKSLPLQRKIYIVFFIKNFGSLYIYDKSLIFRILTSCSGFWLEII